jgi:uroporphyrinogen-III synthase
MCEARTMPRASKKNPLQGWYVISLRPLNLHGGVRRCAAKAGATTFALSPLELRPLAARSDIELALHCPRVIVTSPAAARIANAQFALSSRAGQQWFAIGAGTAAALRACGITQVLLPDSGADSESLLALEQLQQVRGERIGLLTAPGGRGLIASELAARGATLVTAEVYERRARPPSAARLRALDVLPASSALLITSSEALGLLWQELSEPSRDRLRGRPCVVSSERLAAEARSIGFSSVLRASDARPTSLIKALVLHVSEPRFR